MGTVPAELRDILVSAGIISGEKPLSDASVRALKEHVHLIEVGGRKAVYQTERENGQPLSLKRALGGYMRELGLNVPQELFTSQGGMLTEFAGTSLAEKAKGAYPDRLYDLEGVMEQLARLHAASVKPRDLRREDSLRQHVQRKRDLTGEFVAGFAEHFSGDHSLLKRIHRSLDAIVQGEQHLLLYGGTIDDFTERDGIISMVDPDRVAFGLPQEDLFRILEDQRAKLSAGEKKGLLEHYLAALARESGKELSPGERARFLDLYSVIAVSEHLKTCALLDGYACHPDRSVSKDDPQTFRERAQHHLQAAFNHLDVALDNGYEDGLFWLALREYISSTPLLQEYWRSLRTGRKPRWQSADGIYGFVRTMQGDIKGERKRDVLYSLYLRQNEDRSFEAIVAREGSRLAHFESGGPEHAEELFEAYVHRKNEFEMRASLRNKLLFIGATAGFALGVGAMGFYTVSLMSQQLFGTANFFLQAYQAANAYCAKSALLSLAFDVAHGPVVIATVAWPFEYGGELLSGLLNRLHKGRHERKYDSLAPLIEEDYEERLC